MLIKKIDPFTGKTNEVEIPVTIQQLEDWGNGKMIQDAMPNLNPDQREFLMTGIMPDSWEKNIKEHHWQDAHIIKNPNGSYDALDETGQYNISDIPFETIQEARDALTHYSMQLCGNTEN